MSKSFNFLFLAFCALLPAYLWAENRPGFYNAEQTNFKIEKYAVSVRYENGQSDTKRISIDGLGTKHIHRGETTGNNTSIAFSTPHLNRISLGASFSQSNANASAWIEGAASSSISTSSNHTESTSLGILYLVNNDFLINGTLSQAVGSAAHQTQRRFGLQFMNNLNKNIAISGRIGGLFDEEIVNNGVKDVGVSVGYTSSSSTYDMHAYVDIHNATIISRSYTSGNPIASEEKYRGIAMGGAFFVRNERSRIGLIGNYVATDRPGRPKNFTIGPRYIFTAPDFEITLSASHRINSSENVETSRGTVEYDDAITNELMVGLAKDFSNDLFLQASIKKYWNKADVNDLGNVVRTSSESNNLSFNLTLTKQF